MCSAHPLIVLYIYDKFNENNWNKFHQNIWNSFQLTEWTLVHGRNGYSQYLRCTKGRNSKGRLTRVMVLCSACRHIVFYICVRFHENISKRVFNSGADMSTCGNGYVQCSKSNISKNGQTGVTVHVFCTSCHSALHLCFTFRQKPVPEPPLGPPPTLESHWE